MNIDLQITHSTDNESMLTFLDDCHFYYFISNLKQNCPMTALLSSSWMTNFVGAEWTSNFTHNFTLVPAEIQIEDPYSIVSRHLQLFKRVTEERLCHRAVLSIGYDRETSLIVNDQPTVLTLIHTTWRNEQRTFWIKSSRHDYHKNRYLSCHTRGLKSRHVKLILK